MSPLRKSAVAFRPAMIAMGFASLLAGCETTGAARDANLCADGKARVQVGPPSKTTRPAVCADAR